MREELADAQVRMRASSVSRSSVRAVTPRIVVPASAKLGLSHESLPRGARSPRFLRGAASARPRPPPRTRGHPGFDGVDAHVVEEMLGRGASALADLQKRGGYSPLTPTIPAQTPVS